MTIKRYFANADNTITNAFKANLTLRGTGSNSGESDILEVFSIYGQASSGSLEKSRVLIKFPVSKIKSDRDSSAIPASGSVKFVLRVFNAEHGQTLPKKYSLAVLPVSRSWSEGSGLDMEEYSDEMPSSWVFASDTKVPDITDIKFISTTKNDYSGKYFILRDNSNARYNLWFDHNGSQTAPNLDGTEIEADISAGGLTTVNHFAKKVRDAINAQSINISASISEEDTLDSTGATVRITNTGNGGTSGSVVPASIADNSVFTLTVAQRGGQARWTTTGGDFHEVGYTPGKNLPHYSQFLSEGTEDLEINITSLVEEWLEAESTVDPDRESYGVLIKMSGSFEDGSLRRSYYTKKFFARGTEFFFKRPHIEARWDSSVKDDRANFYKSSSLATGAENLNTLYVYNYTRNGLSNIPALSNAQDGSDQVTDTPVMKVRLYNKKSGKAEVLPVGGGVTDGRAKAVITVAGNPGNGETFTMTDSAGTAVTFTFNTGNNTVSATAIGIAAVLGNNTNIAGRIQQAIALTSLAITAVDNSDGTVTVTQDAVGTAGNKSLNMASVANVSVPSNTFAGGHAQDFAHGYLKETGIYSASLAYTGSATKVYDVWSTNSDHTNQLFTGSAINVKTHKPVPYNNADEDYILAITNLKSLYKTSDKPSLRISVRKKDFQPNIYSVATRKSPQEVLYNLYYRAYRVIDDTEVISYGSGSIPHTKASYDASGSYFTLDMSLFESGYMYSVEIATDSYGQNIVNKDEFKFRVE